MFQLGRLLITPGALNAFIANETTPIQYIRRHLAGDWGELTTADKRENDFSLSRNLRLLSAYHLPDRTKLWIITEADRSATTILLPEEY